VENQALAGGNRSGSMTREQRWRFSVVHSLPDDRSTGAGLDSRLDSLNALDSDSAFPSEGSIGGLHPFGLSNESSRLHLQTILDQEILVPGEGRRMLMELPGMTLEAADGILDWIDPDDERREFGAEYREYSQAEVAAGPRNAVPPVLEELLFVQGVSRSVFYGSTFAAGGFEDEPTEWSEHLTVWSAESNTDANGRRRINLNARKELSATANNEEANADFGRSSFGADESDSGRAALSDDLLRFIQLAAVYGVVDEPNGDDNVLEIDVPEELSNPDFEPIPINSLAALVDVSVRIPQSAGNRQVASPLQSSAPDFVERFRELEENATLEPGVTIIGRVNVNLASAAVLRAVTGDPAIASRIVTERESLETEERRTTVWLLSKQIVDLSTFRNILPLITAGGDVSTGEIIVYRRTGGPFLRRRLTIDASRRPARRLDWTDLTERGLPVPTSTLEYQSGFGNTGF